MSSAPPPMTPLLGGPRIQRLAAGWRGPLVAAALVFVTALPGLIAVPPLDRDESRFAQATAQMLETGDFVNIRYQSEPRDKKPVGIHWLQAAAVSLASSVERREIWAYRLPSLIAAMVSAAAAVWGARRAFGAAAGLVAGVAFGVGLLVSTEAFIAKTDSVLCAAVTVMMAGLGRLYLSTRRGDPLSVADKLALWSGFALSVIDKGPVGPMIAGLSLAALAAMDRKVRWMTRLGWGWGLLLTLAVVGPWALAITVSTDGHFWTGAVGGDLAPKLAGGKESHGAPPGLHALLSPILTFPGTALLPMALAYGWLKRRDDGVRFALAWLLPAWIVFELTPTKLIHYPMPTYGALAWLIGAAATDPVRSAIGARTRWAGAVLSVVVGIVLAAAFVALTRRYDGDMVWAVVTGAACVAAAVAAALLALGYRPVQSAAVAVVLAVGGHALAVGALAPSLRSLWVSRNAARLIADKHLDPRNGVTQGPVAVVGYAEPSLVFLLGTQTELDDPSDAADAVAEGEPALVERRQVPAFEGALRAVGTQATVVGETKGLDYSTGKAADLLLYRSNAPPPKDDDTPAP